MIRTPILSTAWAAALSLCLCAGPACAQVVPIVSAKSGIVSLTPNQLADIFLGKSSRFPDGSPAIPCDYVEDSPVREEFYAKFVGKSPAQVKAYWAKIIFTGRGQPPRVVADGDHAKRLVAENPGAICYVDRRYADRSVTVLIPK